MTREEAIARAKEIERSLEYDENGESVKYTYELLADALMEGYQKAMDNGYKEAIKVAKEWLIGHTSTDIECNENGEPLADSYIKSRKLAIEIANLFESDMNKLWKEKK